MPVADYPTRGSSDALPSSGPAEALVLRPAWRQEWFSFLVLALGLMLLLKPWALPGFEALWAWFAEHGYPVPLESLVRVLGVLVVLMYAGIVLWNRFRWCYFIGPFGVESQRGLLGRDERRAEYANVTYVRLSQGFVARLFGIGDLLIGTSATSDPEVVFRGVTQPRHWKALIQSRLRDQGKPPDTT